MTEERDMNGNAQPVTGKTFGNEEQHQKLSWEIYRQFHESTPIGYLVLDTEDIILSVNLSGAKLLGAPREKLIGRKMDDFVNTQFHAKLRSCLQDINDSTHWHECEMEITRYDGSSFYALIQGSQIPDNNQLVVFMSDITQRRLTEIALKESELKYREVADRLAEGVFETDPRGKVTYANNKVLSSFGLNGDDLRSGITAFDFIAPRDLPVAVERFERVLNQEDVGAGEYLLKRKDGATFPALVHTLAIIREGKVTGLRGILIDISERKRIEIALEESEKKYRELAELLNAGIIEADTTGTLKYANRTGMALFGLTDEDLKNGFSVFDVIVPEDVVIARDNFMKILKQENIGPIEYSIRKKDGTTFPALTYGSAIIREGKVEGLRGVVIDISEMKKAEQAVANSERKYRELTELLDSGVFEADATGVLTYANRKALSLFGLDEKDLNQMTIFSVIVPKDLNTASSNFSRVLKQEDVGPVEYMVMKRNGTIFPALTYVSAVVREGKVVGIRGIVVDNSERKNAEIALKESERRYRELTDLLDEGVFEMDREGNFTYANQKGLSYFGYDENDLKNGLNVYDTIAPGQLEFAKEKLAGTLNRKDTGAVEFQIVRKDGTTFPALTHGSAIIRDDAVIGIRGVVFDISDLKNTERALRESEERFRTFVKSLHEGIWVLDENDITTFVNPRMAEMLGYDEEEMIGKPVYSFAVDEWKTFTIEQMERRKQGVTEQIEGELSRKDGGKVYALLETSPILDEVGRYAGSIAGVQDITERKIAEEKLKQTLAELDRSNKELEQFAYVTSHDLREPLRMMTSFSQSLEKRYKSKLDSTANEYINYIVDGAMRMQRLIDDILIYSRVTTRGQPFEAVEMESVLQEVLLNLKAAIDESKARITHDSLPVIQADAAQMKQVMQNLIANAVKFHKESETPIVHISSKREDKEWLFSVKDNGIGMNPELFGRLFNLFQRLHPPDKYPGTGVGLAVTKKIVMRHGGKIWLESQPGKGSTFYFTIPFVK